MAAPPLEASTKKDFILRAKEKRGTELPPSVNGERIVKKLEDETLRLHQQKLDEWDRFVREERLGATAHDLEALKHFVYLLAVSIDGTKGLEACVETVRSYWNRFTAAWKRKYEAIPRDITESVTNYIYGELMEELRLLREKKPRRYANNNHLIAYARLFWAFDWKEYSRPATRQNDWDLFLVDIYCSARIADYIESTCRRGTGRGLKFKDMKFICFWNKYGKPEFAIQRMKDAKNTSNSPESKKPKNSIAEGCEEELLCTNSLLFTLAKLLSMRAFRDYETIESLLQVAPPKDTKSIPIIWRDDILEKPFFSSASRDGSIETANAFHSRIIDGGVRAGFPEPPTMHDWRANSLFLIDMHYSESDRMRAAAHECSGTYVRSYQSSESRVDGQNTFLGNERREDVSDAFLELSVPYTPNLAQRLPAEERYKLQRSQEWLELEEEIEALQNKKNTDWKGSIQELQRKKSWLMDETLRKWQKEQPYRPDDPPRYHYGIFDRCRFMMPERDRLATNLFKKAVLRSPLGLLVLRDLMTLLKKTSEVEFRPGLELDKCVCPKVKKASHENENDNNKTPSKYDWRHIYNCYKKNCSRKYGFAELCFRCNDWIFSEKEWRVHCLGHLQDLKNFQIYFDPLIYGGVLATPGYCPYCLRDEGLPPEKRMYQYLNRAKWLVHFQTHVKELEKREREGESIVKCPHPESRCPKSFHSVLHLRFHLEDIHGIPVGNESKAKAKNGVNEQIIPSEKRHKVKKERPESSCFFINNTAATMMTSSQRISKTSSTSSTTSSYPLYNGTRSEKGWFGSNKPPLSGSSDAKDDLASDLDFVVIDAPDNFVMIGEVDTSARPLDYQMSVVDPALEGDGGLQETLLELECESVISSQEISNRSAPSCSTEGLDSSSAPSSHGTPVSSEFSEDLIDQAISPLNRLGLATIEIVDLTDTDDIPQPNPYNSETSEKCAEIGIATVEGPRDTGLIDLEDDEWEVEELQGRRKVGRGFQYLVKWAGFPDSENTWVKKKDIISAELVAAYDAMHPFD